MEQEINRAADDAVFLRTVSRWLRGEYLHAKDAAQALVFFIDRTSGEADMGIDFEAMADNALYPSTGSKGGDTRALLRSRKLELTRAIGRAIGHTTAFHMDLWIWIASRVRGDHQEKIARVYQIPVHEVDRICYDFDADLENALRSRGLLRVEGIA